MNQISSDRNQIASLDGWRAVAVLIVFLSHAGLGHVIPGGLGVTVFFFLSGFLITTLILKEYRDSHTLNIGNFYVRRFLRLTPPLLVMLGCSYTLVLAGALSGAVTLQGFLAQIFYCANYYALFFDSANTTPSGTGVLWSLAVEEHFYLVFPAFMLLLLKKTNTTRIPLILLAISIGVLLWRMYLCADPHFNPNRIYYATDTRIDSILFGAILATCWDPLNARVKIDPRFSSLLPVSVALGILVFTVLFRNDYFRETTRYTLQGIALMPLFIYSIVNSKSLPFKVLNMPWLKRIGVYSYSIYLSHYVLLESTKEITPYSLLNPAIALTTAIIFSLLVEHLVDSRLRSLRARFR